MLKINNVQVINKSLQVQTEKFIQRTRIMYKTEVNLQLMYISSCRVDARGGRLEAGVARSEGLSGNGTI